MSIRKVRLSDDNIKWEVSCHEDGRGSKRIRRRFDTKTDAEDFIESQKTERRQAALLGISPQQLADTTFGKEADHWLAQRGAQMTNASRLRVSQILNASVLPKFKDCPPLSLRKSVLQKYQTDLLNSGLKPRTVNRMVGVVKAVLNFSVEEERIPYNPTAKLRPLKGARLKIPFWTAEEAGAFLNFSNAKYPFGTPMRWIYVVYLLRLNTAIRSAEGWGLKVKDIQSASGLIHCARQLEYTTKTLQPTKGKSERYVPCNDLVLFELSAWIKYARLGPEDLVFTGRTGEVIDDHSFNRHYLAKDVKASGVKRLHPHGFKHTAVTLMIGSGADLKTVQEIAGHEHIETTMGYAHALESGVRKVAKDFRVAPIQTATVNGSPGESLPESGLASRPVRHLRVVK
ncbi:MAG: tyrosine-type recombinase/integrase [Bdellovibrionales bacterium]|nr:tyrosine-type recombinase/integrase [Bdellovibrionales bacterium]